MTGGKARRPETFVAVLHRGILPSVAQLCGTKGSQPANTAKNSRVASWPQWRRLSAANAPTVPATNKAVSGRYRMALASAFPALFMLASP